MAVLHPNKPLFHPKAAKRYDEMAQNLVERTDCAGVPDTDDESLSSFPSRRPYADILRPTGDVYREDQFPWTGERGATDVFRSDGSRLHLSATSSDELRRLALRISEQPRVRPFTSPKFVESKVRDWVTQPRHRHQKLSEFISEQLRSSVARREFWIPIHGLEVAAPIDIGTVSFRTISPLRIRARERLHRQAWSATPETDLEGTLERDRLTLQGRAAGVTAVVADDKTGEERALAMVEDALALLRLFHPANASIACGAQIVPLGSENHRAYRTLVVEGGLFGSESMSLRDRPELWRVSREYLGQFRSQLRHVQDLACATAPTDLQECILNSLRMYSRNVIALDLADKLVYVLVSLEMLLLRDGSESVAQSVADRFALLGPEAEAGERKEQAALLKSAYGLRSKYVHHGQRPDPQRDQGLQRFLLAAWRFFLRIPRVHRAYDSKAALLDAVDELKYRF